MENDNLRVMHILYIPLKRSNAYAHTIN